MNFNEQVLIERKDLREKLINRLEVLDKVGELLLLPNTELATTKMVANFYKVKEVTIKQLYNRNKDELTKNGVKTLRGTELQALKTELQDVTLLGRANAVTIYTKRAILNVGMLLTESEIATRLRTALLDQQELLTDEQKVQSITEEQMLLLKIIQSPSEAERAVALSEYNNYKNKHISELNARIEEMKPKEDAYDTFIDAKNNQSMNKVAKSLGIGRNKLFEFLREQKILMNNNTPYQRFIDNGYFEVKQNPIKRGGYIINHSQTYVTAKGIDYINKKLKEYREKVTN